MGTVRRRLVAIAFLLALLAPLAAPAQDGIAAVRAVISAHRGSESGAFVDAQFDLELPPNLQDAVEHGTPLYFRIELQVSRSRWWWFDKRLVDDGYEYRLTYSPLTRRYRLARGGLAQPFESLDAALAAVRRVGHWRVGDADLLDGGNVQARIRLRLDTSMLPKPFQVSALTERDWNLASDWTPLAFAPDGAP